MSDGKETLDPLPFLLPLSGESPASKDLWRGISAELPPDPCLLLSSAPRSPKPALPACLHWSRPGVLCSHLCFSLSLCISAFHDLFWEITVSVHVCFSLTFFFFFFPFVFSILSHCQSPFLFVFVSLPLFPSLFLYCSISLSLSLNFVYFSVYLCPSLLGFFQPSIADFKEYHRHGPSTPALRS